LRKVPGLLVANVALAIKCRLRGVRTKFIVASMLLSNDVGAAIFVDFLPRALAAQRYLIAPEPHVIGTGLATLQAGLDRQKTGVSASKVVVTLEP
jgi:hypothetical protein